MQVIEQKRAAEWKEEFDRSRVSQVSIGEVVDRTKIIHRSCRNASRIEVLDQTISLLKLTRECCNVDIHTWDKQNLDSITGALIDVLIGLRRWTITPSGSGFSYHWKKGKNLERPSLKIPDIHFSALVLFMKLTFHS